MVPIIIEFMTDRRMTVRYNTASSKWHSLVGGSPQGSWMGQMAYIAVSDDAARGLECGGMSGRCSELALAPPVGVGAAHRSTCGYRKSRELNQVEFARVSFPFLYLLLGVGVAVLPRLTIAAATALHNQ